MEDIENPSPHLHTNLSVELTKEKTPLSSSTNKTILNNKTADIERQNTDTNEPHQLTLPSLDIQSINSFLFPFTQLFQKNFEFKIITSLFTSWIALTLFEFLYALINSDTLIISDGFFNTFKTISFLITCLSILFSHLTSTSSHFLYKRIEIIASLTSIIFLVIVSVYMCLQSLHLLTEEHEIIPPVNFFKWFYVLKVIVDLIALMPFSDYILHPSIHVKLFLWKICKEWKNLNDISYSQLKQCGKVLKGWNNHYENMNALCVSLISDLFCSISFIVFFYMFEEDYYDKGYIAISCANVICVFILCGPVIRSVIKILMQGKCEVYNAFYNKVNKEITYFEGCLGMKDLKFWMCAQNDMKCYVKLYAKKELDKGKLKEMLHNIADDIELNCDFTIHIDY